MKCETRPRTAAHPQHLTTSCYLVLVDTLSIYLSTYYVVSLFLTPTIQLCFICHAKVASAHSSHVSSVATAHSAAPAVPLCLICRDDSSVLVITTSSSQPEPEHQEKKPPAASCTSSAPSHLTAIISTSQLSSANMWLLGLSSQFISRAPGQLICIMVSCRYLFIYSSLRSCPIKLSHA